MAVFNVSLNVNKVLFRSHLFNAVVPVCGETPYVKLITQLYGDRQMVANATGCSSIYSGSVPSTPYCTNEKGHGPAWANSLFEDFCEFGMGMVIANEKMRERLEALMSEIADCADASAELKEAAQRWFEVKDDADQSREIADQLIPMIEACKANGCELCSQIAELSHFLVKRSQWIIGGDGASYDIGFGGLDHVIASGENVNILVFDTEVYSNTGGQASKASNIGQVAQFAAAGKEIAKKSLAEIAMSYGYVYVAQIAMGANMNQTLKAIQEAEAYNGPSLIIGYSPCEMHSIKGGMTYCQAEMKKAVECGYWNMFRFNPALKAEGKNPFSLDSKAPSAEYQAFIKSEARYTRLMREFPERAEKLFKKSEAASKARYAHLLKLKDLYAPDAE